MSKYSAYNAGYALGYPIVSIGISLLLNITLLTAAKYIRLGMAGGDQQAMNYGLFKMANYFRIFGIILICILAFCVLALVAGALIGAAGGFGR